MTTTGRPKAQPQLTERQVTFLASIGCTDLEIAEAAGVSRSTLQRTFGVQLKEGRASLRTRLRKAQVDSALAGNTTMLIWLGKQYLAQRDRYDVETHERDVREMTDAELRAIVDGR